MTRLLEEVIAQFQLPFVLIYIAGSSNLYYRSLNYTQFGSVNTLKDQQTILIKALSILTILTLSNLQNSFFVQNYIFEITARHSRVSTFYHLELKFVNKTITDKQALFNI